MNYYLYQSPSDPLPIVLGSEREKPTLADYSLCQDAISAFKEDLALWFSNCVKYKIADGHEEEFMRFAIDELKKDDPRFWNDLDDYLKESILLPSESVRIETLDLCKKNCPCPENVCVNYKETYAFFVDKVKEGESNEAIEFAEWIFKNGWWWTGSHFVLSAIPELEQEPKTTKELYDIFKSKKQ